MSEPSELVRIANERAARIKAVEVELEQAKKDYHEAVRKMHIQGMSLREIASLLNLSHQRVHQIVESQNRGWKFWLRPVNRSLVCSFCGSTAEQVEKLVAGPDIFMCNGCGANCLTMLRTQKPVASKGNKFQLVDKGTRLRCSFCGKMPGAKTPLVASSHHQVCGTCLQLAIKYMEIE